MTAKHVRSTIEKSWSGNAAPIDQAAFEVGARHDLDVNAAMPDTLPKSLGRGAMKSALEQKPGLNQDVIRRYKSWGARENGFGPGVVPIANYSCCKPGR